MTAPEVCSLEVLVAFEGSTAAREPTARSRFLLQVVPILPGAGNTDCRPGADWIAGLSNEKGWGSGPPKPGSENIGLNRDVGSVAPHFWNSCSRRNLRFLGRELRLLVGGDQRLKGRYFQPDFRDRFFVRVGILFRVRLVVRRFQEPAGARTQTAPSFRSIFLKAMLLKIGFIRAGRLEAW